MFSFRGEGVTEPTPPHLIHRNKFIEASSVHFVFLCCGLHESGFKFRAVVRVPTCVAIPAKTVSKVPEQWR